jgi:hypothetical protein
MIDITSRPEYNPLGTVRGSIGGGSWVLTGVFLPTPAPNMWVSVLTGEHVTHLMISLSGMPVIGAVPGTPAWELWKNHRPDPEAQCTEWLDFHDSGSRCLYPDHHPGPHSFQDAAQCTSARMLPHFTRCAYDTGHGGLHSYQVRDVTEKTRPAEPATRKCGSRTDDRQCTLTYNHGGPCDLQLSDHEDEEAIRLCAIRRGASYCRRLRGHTGPCAWPPGDDGDHEDTYQ